MLKCITGISPFFVLHRYYIFLQIEGLWQLCMEQISQLHFSKSFAHFVSLCNILVILPIFQVYYYYYACCGDLWLMIFDVTIVIVLGAQGPGLCKTENLINVKCVLTASPPAILSSLSLASAHPHSLRHNNIEIRPINNHTMFSKCSWERNSHMSLILN